MIDDLGQKHLVGRVVDDRLGVFRVVRLAGLCGRSVSLRLWLQLGDGLLGRNYGGKDEK
jgi:hypothetical protein